MNNFHIYEEIGRGKYSVVYKGRKKKTIEYVAVKSVERYRRRKLMNEVRIFHNLEHKNILKFHNWYETRNHLWIIFEYCPAGDLFRLLEEDKKMPEKTVRKFSFDLVEGLSFLHLNSIIFADLKPSNVMINEFSALKLSDFGLSKKISDLMNESKKEAEKGEEEKKDASKAGRHGSPFYMAPELFQDHGVLSFASDFWSLGCIMFEMATGKPPFCSSSLKTLIQMILENDAPTVENFGPEFNSLISQLLTKDPTERITWDELKKHPFWASEGAVAVSLKFTPMKAGTSYPD
jgi:serine/threonine-protein kinase ULK4